MEGSWYMNKSKMECENGDDPVVDTSRGCNVRICKHAFDVLCINLNDKIAAYDDIKPECVHCSIKAIEFELWLGESGFTLIKGDRAKACKVVDFGVTCITFAEDVTNCDI